MALIEERVIEENTADITSTVPQKKPDSKTRTVRVFIRLFPEEKQRFISLCLRAGMSQADFFRRHTLKVKPVRHVKAAQVNEAHLLSLLGQIGRIGNNINQIARHLNRGDTVTADQIRASLQLLQQLHEQVKHNLNPANDNTQEDR